MLRNSPKDCDVCARTLSTSSIWDRCIVWTFSWTSLRDDCNVAVLRNADRTASCDGDGDLVPGDFFLRIKASRDRHM